MQFLISQRLCIFLDNVKFGISVNTHLCDIQFSISESLFAVSVNWGANTFVLVWNWPISLSVVKGVYDHWMFSIQVSSGLIGHWMPVPLCVVKRYCSVTPFKAECQLPKHKILSLWGGFAPMLGFFCMCRCSPVALVLGVSIAEHFLWNEESFPSY